ncbi:MAG TPA: PTS sugar transporter subunit IIA [Chitinivibrionales bacterium]|nr:PTS sugar transporter subunit IIA [Chitinivibrionales bacterium]
MKSLLTAIDEGRLVELPDANKEKALEFLALLIEAIPGIAAKNDIVLEVKVRERTGNTGIGKGVACPHARREGEGDLLCAIGWSPQGIDYGSIDGQKVHLVIMYYIPDSQRNYYLKEISGLARAIETAGGITTINNATDIHAVRDQLLDWISYVLDSAVPESRARMIKLQEKEAAGEVRGKASVSIIPFSVILVEAQKPLVLSPDASFLRVMESQAGLSDLMKKNEPFEVGGYQVIVRTSSSFALNRFLHECLAIKIGGNN